MPNGLISPKMAGQSAFINRCLPYHLTRTSQQGHWGSSPLVFFSANLNLRRRRNVNDCRHRNRNNCCCSTLSAVNIRRLRRRRRRLRLRRCRWDPAADRDRRRWPRRFRPRPSWWPLRLPSPPHIIIIIIIITSAEAAAVRVIVSCGGAPDIITDITIDRPEKWVLYTFNTLYLWYSETS